MRKPYQVPEPIVHIRRTLAAIPGVDPWLASRRVIRAWLMATCLRFPVVAEVGKMAQIAAPS